MKYFQFLISLFPVILIVITASAQQNKERNLLSGRYSENFLEEILKKVRIGFSFPHIPTEADGNGFRNTFVIIHCKR